MERNETTEASPPRPEKRGIHQTVVTPSQEGGNEEEMMTKKVRPSKYSLKLQEDVSVMNMMSNACEGYMISMRGNLDLFYVEQGQTEAFVNPVMELLFGSSDIHNAKFQKEQLYKKSKIIAVVPRRVSLNVDEPQMKHGGTKADPDAKFKKHYFVSLSDNAMESIDEKKERLEGILSVRKGFLGNLLHMRDTSVPYDVVILTTHFICFPGLLSRHSFLNTIVTSIPPHTATEDYILVQRATKRSTLSYLKISTRRQRLRNAGMKEFWT
jgi:hypothetical protein